MEETVNSQKNSEEECNSDNYDDSVVMVDPADVDQDSKEEENEDEDNKELKIDDTGEYSDDQYEVQYDPLSLVSVGLEEDDDLEEDEEISKLNENQEQSCTFCPKTFTCRKQLNGHIKLYHQTSCSVVCQYCGCVLGDAENYGQHLETVHQIKIPELLGNGRSNNLFAVNNMSPVLSIPALVKKCPDCDQQFATKTTLNIHRLKVHVADLKNLPCPQCSEEVPDLTSHMRRVHNVDGIVCPHCANIFSKKCTLNRHIEQVHLNIQIHKPATCPECHKVFSKKGHLDRHIKIIHKGIKDYSDPCPYCGKVFTTRASLEPHIAMVHEGVRKKCPICNKVLSDLNKHMRTVHGTYRRKAKIPKELIGEMDDPEASITPQIYGAGGIVAPTTIEQCIKGNRERSKSILETSLTSDKVNRLTTTKSSSHKKKNIVSISPGGSSMKEFQLCHDNNTESIKTELGLSSGITLQKIVRPLKPPPKLTYHGPKTGLVQNNNKSIPPTTNIGYHENPRKDHEESNSSKFESHDSSMVKMSGTFSQKITETFSLPNSLQHLQY